MEARGWDAPDFVFISGDAYVDHPSFGPSIISRVLEAHGYRVAMLAQPDWRDDASVRIFGRPKLGFLVSSGNMDSMVNHYTVAKKRRSFDAYSPGGETGRRPARMRSRQPSHLTILFWALNWGTWKGQALRQLRQPTQRS